MTLIKVEGFKCNLNSEIISFNSFVILASWSFKKYGNGCLRGNESPREKRAQALDKNL